MAFARLERLTTQGDAVKNEHVIADLGGLANNNTHAVVNNQPPTEFGAWVNLDAGYEARVV